MIRIQKFLTVYYAFKRIICWMIVLNKTEALHEVKKIFFAASFRIRINATDTLTSSLKQLIYMLQEIGNSRKPKNNENDFLKFDIDSNLSFLLLFLNKRYTFNFNSLSSFKNTEKQVFGT